MNLIKHAHLLNRLSSLFLTELDVLDDLEEIKVCKKYKLGDEIVDGVLPPLISDFGKMIPEYKILKGWKQKTDEIEKFDQLPVNAQTFVREIERMLKVEVSYISVNNEEEEGIIRIMR